MEKKLKENEEILELVEDKKDKELVSPKKGRAMAFISVIVIIGIVILYLITVIYKDSSSKKAIVKKLPSVIAVTTVIAVTKDEIVGPKEGRQHAYIRQLEKNPGLVNEDPRLKKFAYKGDLLDKKKLHKWAGEMAHRISILNGEIDQKFGAQVWVGVPNKVAYRLVKAADGKAEIQIRVANAAGSFSKNPDSVQKLAKDFSSVQFRGDIPDGMLTYERIYLGQPG
jgi:hypothetical protein